MITKNVFGLSIAAVFAMSMMLLPIYADGHLTILKAEAKPGKLEIDVSAPIPQDGSAGAFGYGVFTTSGSVVAVTTHGGVGPDSEAQVDADDPVFHSHLVTLTDVTACGSGLAVASASFEEIGTLKVDDAEVKLTDITEELTSTVVSFSLTVENGDICVNPVVFVEASD